jgi:hypothetical protein
MSGRKRPSLGRSEEERGYDEFDTPPIALEPLFVHEPLLAGVRSVAEPFCGQGNLVTAMRERGLTVHASDIQARGCPDSRVLDFLEMTERPDGCDVLLSNPPFSIAMEIIEHAWALGFRVVILLLEPSFLHSAERFERLHPRGHLRRHYPIAERLQSMHDAAHIAEGGKKASQPRMHSWYVFDRNYCGDAATIPVSIKNPAARMPWQVGPRCDQCDRPYRPKRLTARFCGDACRQRAHRALVSVT